MVTEAVGSNHYHSMSQIIVQHPMVSVADEACYWPKCVPRKWVTLHIL